MEKVDQYLKKIENPAKTQLSRIRAKVITWYPQAEECMTYGVPGFKLDGSYLLGYASFKNHIGLYPTPGPIVTLKKELEKYKCSKGAIQIPFESPIADNLLKKLVQTRAKEIQD